MKKHSLRRGLKIAEGLLFTLLIALLGLAFMEVAGSAELARTRELASPFTGTAAAPVRQFAVMVDNRETAANLGVLEGLKQQAQQAGAVLTVYPVEGRETLSQAFELAELTQCEGIFVMLRQNQGAKEEIQAAIEKGLRVVVVDNDAPDSMRDAYVGANPLLVGKMAAAMTVKYYKTLPPIETTAALSTTPATPVSKAQLSVLLLLGPSYQDSAGLSSNAYLNGFQQGVTTFDRNASVQVAYTRDADAQSLVEAALKANEVRAIVCTDPEDTLKVMNLLVEYNRIGDMVLIGSGNQPAVAEGVGKGLIEASVQVDYAAMGHEAVRLMTSLLEDDAPTAYQLMPIDVLESEVTP